MLLLIGHLALKYWAVDHFFLLIGLLYTKLIWSYTIFYCFCLDRAHTGRRGADSTVPSSEDEGEGHDTLSVVSNCSETPGAVRSTDGT